MSTRATASGSLDGLLQCTFHWVWVRWVVCLLNVAWANLCAQIMLEFWQLLPACSVQSTVYCARRDVNTYLCCTVVAPRVLLLGLLALHTQLTLCVRSDGCSCLWLQRRRMDVATHMLSACCLWVSVCCLCQCIVPTTCTICQGKRWSHLSSQCMHTTGFWASGASLCNIACLLPCNCPQTRLLEFEDSHDCFAGK